MTAAALFFPGSVFSGDPKARAIMQKVDDRDDGDNMTTSMLMILIDKNGNKRKKYLTGSP